MVTRTPKLTTRQVHEKAVAYVQKLFRDAGFRLAGTDPFAVTSPRGRQYSVTTIGATTLNYRYVLKSRFVARRDDLLALVLFTDSVPETYLISGPALHSPQAPLSSLLKDRDYVGLQSPPEFGVDLRESTLPLLRRFGFETVIGSL